MAETFYILIIVIEAIIIIFLGMIFYISLAIMMNLKQDNKKLTKEVIFQKRISKTFSDGLEAFNNFKQK